MNEFHFLQFQKWPKINFWTEKKFKTVKNTISQILFFDLFDFTSFFAWTFLNFLAHCAIVNIISESSAMYFCNDTCIKRKARPPTSCAPSHRLLKLVYLFNCYERTCFQVSTLAKQFISMKNSLMSRSPRSLCTIFTILLTLWNYEPQNGQLI